MQLSMDLEKSSDTRLATWYTWLQSKLCVVKDHLRKNRGVNGLSSVSIYCKNVCLLFQRTFKHGQFVNGHCEEKGRQDQERQHHVSPQEFSRTVEFIVQNDASRQEQQNVQNIEIGITKRID